MAHSARREGTAIYTKCYNNRGLIPHRFGGSKNLVRQANGHLWALISNSTASSLLMKSTDNGFTWQRIIDLWFDQSEPDPEHPEDNITNGHGTTEFDTRQDSGHRINGAINNLALFPEFNKILVTYACMDTSDYFRIHYAYADLNEDLTKVDKWTPRMPVLLDNSEVQEGVFSYVNTSRWGYFIYVDGDDNLNVRAHNVTDLDDPEDTSQETSKTWIPQFDAYVDEDNNIDILCVAEGASGQDQLCHVRYTESDGFGDITVIDSAPGTSQKIIDVAIARDGYGTICAVWGETNATDTDANWRISISTNNGVNWSGVDMAKETGNSVYLDTVTSETTVRTDVIGGLDGGFLVTYTQDNSSNIPQSYLRFIATANGVVYTISIQEDLDLYDATQVVAGLKFFKPAEADALIEFDDLGLVRVATQLKEGDSELMNDRTPVTFDQFLLREGPFPSALDTEDGSYETDLAADTELLVNLQVVSAVSENIDFYSLGMIGDKTERYRQAFDRLGVSTRFLKYEPTQNSKISGRAGYDDPTEHCAKVVWQPQSYGFPIPQLATSLIDDYVEKDVRKIYLPPTFHLSRIFTRNDGNYFKRTVWIAWFDGNEYELSQVVPHFIGNQICYYECNAYVIGPSRDPFARVILPSET